MFNFILQSTNDYFHAIQSEIRGQAAYIQAGIETSGDEYLETLQLQTDHRLTIVTPDGEVLFDSTSDTAQMDNHLDRPEIQDALENGTGESIRYSDTVRGQTFYYAVQMDDGTVLCLSSTTASILSSYDQIFWIAILIVAVVILLAALAASAVTRQVIRPINEIDIEDPENNRIYDEIAPLLTRIKKNSGMRSTFRYRSWIRPVGNFLPSPTI